MITTKNVDYKTLKNEILELKKSLELTKKNFSKELFYRKSVVFDLSGGNDFFEINFDGQEGEYLNLNFNCDINQNNEYLLIIYFNNIKIFSKKYFNKFVINENISCVLSGENSLKICLESSGADFVLSDILLCGSVFNLPENNNNFLITTNNNVINISDIGRKYKIEYYANLESVLNGEAMESKIIDNKIFDSKLIKIQDDSEEIEVLAYLTDLDGLKLCVQDISVSIAEDVVLDATIIPVKHQLCSMIIAYALNNKIRLEYLDKELNILFVEDLKLKNITNVKHISCAMNDSVENTKIVLMIIDGFDNCYLFGCFDYSDDVTSLNLNAEPKYLGKGVSVFGYVFGDNFICYFKNLDRCVVAYDFSLVLRGGGWYFIKKSTKKIANVDDVFILDGNEIYIKNNVLGELNINE